MMTSIRYVLLVCIWPLGQALHFGSSGSTPTFYMIDNNLDEMYTRGFQRHPSRTNDLEKADFAVTCCFNGRSLQKFADLPRRSKAKPYLVMVRGFSLDRCSPKDNCKLASELIETRDDFLYVNFDLRDHSLKDDHATPLRGVTVAPPEVVPGLPAEPVPGAEVFHDISGQAEGRMVWQLPRAKSDPESFQRFQGGRRCSGFPRR